LEAQVSKIAHKHECSYLFKAKLTIFIKTKIMKKNRAHDSKIEIYNKNHPGLVILLATMYMPANCWYWFQRYRTEQQIHLQYLTVCVLFYTVTQPVKIYRLGYRGNGKRKNTQQMSPE
jgi:hypothetical protein